MISIFNKPQFEINLVDLQGLRGRNEGTMLEVKRDATTWLVPGLAGEPAKRKRCELVKDITMMANADGGEFLIGIEEEADRVIGDVRGIPNGEIEPLEQHIQSTLLDNTDPRYNSLRFIPVAVDEDRKVLLISVGRPPLGPVRNLIDGEFWKRNGCHGYRMTTSDIRMEMMRNDTTASDLIRSAHMAKGSLTFTPMLVFTSGSIETRSHLFNVEDVHVRMKVEPFRGSEVEGRYFPGGIRFHDDFTEGGLDILERYYLQSTNHFHAAFEGLSSRQPFSCPKTFAKMMFFMAMKTIQVFGPQSRYLLFSSWVRPSPFQFYNVPEMERHPLVEGDRIDFNPVFFDGTIGSDGVPVIDISQFREAIRELAHLVDLPEPGLKAKEIHDEIIRDESGPNTLFRGYPRRWERNWTLT